MLARRIEDLKKVEEFGGNCSKQQAILREIAQSSVTMVKRLLLGGNFNPIHVLFSSAT